MNEFFKFGLKLGAQVLFNKFTEEMAAEILKSHSSLTVQHKNIINLLLKEAMANGLVADHEVHGYSKQASEGSTANLVAITRADIMFAVKIDDEEKLVREALLLRSIAGRGDLPKGFSNRFPKVYAIKDDGPPYAYIMQAFNRKSYADYIFRGKGDGDEIIRIGDRIIDALIPAYKSTVNKNLKPNVSGLYLDRIKKRLKSARASDKEFKAFTNSTQQKINGETYKKPETYLEKIEKNINKFEASFTTFVHGDCHPENILVEMEKNNREIDIKFIDTKDWYEGDYIFDMGKLCHYLEVTGPAETIKNPPAPTIDLKGFDITYNLNRSDPVNRVIQNVLLATSKFADSTSDTHWKNRYNLSMASNLLGLPAGRLEADKRNSAFILYAEGLKYLSLCC